MIWAQLRIILAVRVRVTLRRAQNIFMLKNMNSFTIKKNKPKKMIAYQSGKSQISIVAHKMHCNAWESDNNNYFKP